MTGFLLNRQISVFVNGFSLFLCPFNDVVLQGSVISRTRFLLHVKDLPFYFPTLFTIIQMRVPSTSAKNCPNDLIRTNLMACAAESMCPSCVTSTRFWNVAEEILYRSSNCALSQKKPEIYLGWNHSAGSAGFLPIIFQIILNITENSIFTIFL